jgi:PAS domain S-box-containing protein
LLSLAPDPMAVTDLEDGRLLDVNQTFVNWSGYSYQELRGMTSVELGLWMSPRDRAAMVEQLAAAQSVYGLDVRMSNKTGEMRDVVFSARLTERDGRKELFSIVHDITERKRAEDLLHKYAFMVGATPDLMSFIGRDYCYQAVNEAYLRAHQKTRVQIIGHSIAELHGTEAFNTIIKPEIDKCLAGEQIRYAAWFDYTGLGRRFVDVIYTPYTNNERAIMGGV